MDHKVESFPFNVTSQPMYLGSTLNFLAIALWCVARPFFYAQASLADLRLCRRYESPAGLLLTLHVYIVYQIALSYEECVPPPPLPSP